MMYFYRKMEGYNRICIPRNLLNALNLDEFKKIYILYESDRIVFSKSQISNFYTFIDRLGRLTIPRMYERAYGLKKHDWVDITYEDGIVTLKKSANNA